MAGDMTGKPVVVVGEINALSQMDHNIDAIPVS